MKGLRVGREQHRHESSNHSRYIQHVTRNRSQDHSKIYKYIYIYIYICKCTCARIHTHVRSKPLTFHNGFMFYASSRACFKHFCRFQALTAQTDKKEHVNNKIQATTTHVHCVVHDQEGHRKAIGQYFYLILIILSKNKACDCYCHPILIDLSLLSNS